MRIGILTFHEGINHGGFHQAFATWQFLKRQGHSVEIINYKNRKHFLFEYAVFLAKRNPQLILENLRKIWAFRRSQKSMCLSALIMNTKRIPSDFDAIVVGSDVVWNFKKRFFGHDPVYFGQGLVCDRLISYAPSFGDISQRDSAPDYVCKGLRKFHRISVRDRNSQSIVAKVLGHEPEIVLDPTFLIDTTEFEEAVAAPSQKFILVYAYSLRAEEIAAVRSYAQQNDLVILAVGYHCEWADMNITNVNPFQWLTYFRLTSFVITSTFHGALFSIKYRCNFLVSLNDNIQAKLETIVAQLGLEQRLGIVENIDQFDTPINFDDVNRRLEPLVVRSKQYLLSSLYAPELDEENDMQNVAC